MIALGLPAEWFTPRLNLGLGNPNSAGALLAMGLVSLLPLSFGAWWRRALGLVAALAIALALAMTASRGAVAALAAGLLVLGLAAATARADRWMLVLVMAGVIALFAASPAGKRIHAPQADPSMASRREIFSRVPAMIAAAPGGWGAGRSAEAYQNWFQPVGDLRIFNHVLSTHAIWLVERPWAIGWLYVGAWLFAFLWCAMRDPRWMAGGPACWVVFAVAASFSHVGEKIWLWLPPLAWLGIATAARIRRREFPRRKAFLGLGVAAFSVLGGLILFGRPWQAGPHLRRGLVEIAAGDAGSALPRRVSVSVQGDMRTRFGQEIRYRPPAGVVVEYAWDPATTLRGDILFLAGGVSEIPMEPGRSLRKVVWVSPAGILPWKLPAQLREAPIVVLSAQLAPFTTAPWRKYFEEGGRGELKIPPGRREFVPDPWSRMLAEANLAAP